MALSRTSKRMGVGISRPNLFWFLGETYKVLQYTTLNPTRMKSDHYAIFFKYSLHNNEIDNEPRTTQKPAFLIIHL